MSCKRTPENALVTRLKMRESRRLEIGSRRCVFQPVTRSKPSSSLARRRGISAGSSCRSPSIVTTISPCAWSKPATSAAALPKLRRRRTTRTLSSELCNLVNAEKVPSAEPSSTKIARARLYAGRRMAELLSLEEAQKRILDRVTPLTPEVVLLAEAAGRVVFEDALAVVDLP